MFNNSAKINHAIKGAIKTLPTTLLTAKTAKDRAIHASKTKTAPFLFLPHPYTINHRANIKVKAPFMICMVVVPTRDLTGPVVE